MKIPKVELTWKQWVDVQTDVDTVTRKWREVDEYVTLEEALELIEIGVVSPQEYLDALAKEDVEWN